MKASELIATRRPCFSFEFFPPRSDDGVDALFEAIADLRTLDPAFVSMTYGAGGSTRDRTVDLVARVRRETDIDPVAHFASLGSTLEEVHTTLRRLEAEGIETVLALRGDPPRDGSPPRVTDGPVHAVDLIRLIRSTYGFAIGAACHPEGHPEAPDLATDLAYLKRKVEAGADFLVTQLFFDNAAYFAFVDRARAAGITVPIVPGIMPVTNVDQLERFTRMCGATIPTGLADALDARRHDAAAVADLGVAYATLQCAELLRGGAPGIHFYTLNRSPATRAILRALRLLEPWRVA